MSGDANRALVEEVIAFARRGRVLFGEALPRDVPVKVVASMPDDFEHAGPDGKAYGELGERERTFEDIKAEQRALYYGAVEEDGEKKSLVGHARRVLTGKAGPLRSIGANVAVLKCGDRMGEIILDDLLSCAEWRAAFGLRDGFWESVFRVYQSGGMPVGWSGSFPDGCLMVVYPRLSDAKEMLDRVRLANSAAHEYVMANANEFAYLDLTYYERVKEELAAHGFRCLGDIEDLTVNRAWPNTRSFIRCLAGRDGTVMAGIYHVKLLGWQRILTWLGLVRNSKVLDLDTEFTDGCFVCTSNGVAGSPWTMPQEIAAQYHRRRTAAGKLLEIHDARVAQYLRDKRGVRCVRVSSLGELIASQQRMNALKAAYRDGIRGDMLPEEMDRIAGIYRGMGRRALRQMQELDERATDGEESRPERE